MTYQYINMRYRGIIDDISFNNHMRIIEASVYRYEYDV